MCFAEKKVIFERKYGVAEEGPQAGDSRYGEERAPDVPTQAVGSPVPPVMLAQRHPCPQHLPPVGIPANPGLRQLVLPFKTPLKVFS